MKTRNPVVESMYRFTLQNFTVRLWVNRYDQLYFHDDHNNYIKTADSLWQADTKIEIVEAFTNSHPDIAAIEVLDISGNGVVYYPDWN
jgi:hypothetical protein